MRIPLPVSITEYYKQSLLLEFISEKQADLFKRVFQELILDNPTSAVISGSNKLHTYHNAETELLVKEYEKEYNDAE